MEDGLLELPKGWAWSKLGGIALIQGGFAFKSKDYKNNGMPLLRISNIKDHKVTFEEDTVFLDKNFVQEYSDFLIGKGDILIALSGATTGKFDVYEKDETALLNQRVGQIKFYSKSLISSRFIFHYMGIIRRKILSQAYGMAQPNISTKELGEFAIPLPPLPEQHRIVAKIKELFTKLDAGIEALKKIKAQLKCYRQAVLKYAFEGKLTQEWRETNKGKIEPASVLLEKIKEERKKDAKGKFKELTPVDTSELPELPEGWVWIAFSQLISPLKNSIKRGPFGSTVKKAFFVEKGFKVYEQQNAIYDNPRLGNYYISQDKFNELIGFVVKPGDFIVSCSGTIGKITQLPHNAERGIINQALLKLTIDSRLVAPKFFLECFRSDQFQTKLLKETRGSAIKNINSVEDIKIIPVALPPLVEQQKIVEEIDSRLSIADEVEKVAEQSFKQSERLRQSILKQAFEGKLVPQDPTDLPAAELLKQIKKEREAPVCQQAGRRHLGKRRKIDLSATGRKEFKK
jgi:type I restriction enzyme S subunit